MKVDQILEIGDWKLILAGNNQLPHHVACSIDDFELEYVLAQPNGFDHLNTYLELYLDEECIDQDTPILGVKCARCGTHLPTDLKVSMNLIAGRVVV